ncbi:hypothetical protein J4Q44_G00312360 [Coregonus suidteri]|uniref:Uncharacterized protein n=1 Tax=Coregonus suidteri TaxID=861788 RepID=A0AAN8L3J1_9TELE
MKPCWALLTLAILWVEIQNGACQQVSRRKEAGENLIRPGGKQAKFRYPELKEKAAGGRGQSILTQVLDKDRFLRLGESVSLSPRNNIELRYKDSNIGWSYPTYLDTFNDSRLRDVQLLGHTL